MSVQSWSVLFFLPFRKFFLPLFAVIVFPYLRDEKPGKKRYYLER